MPHILPWSANKTISYQTGDYYPVHYNAFARSAQSAETLQNTLRHTCRFVYKHDQSAVLFFCYLCLGAEDIFL